MDDDGREVVIVMKNELVVEEGLGARENVDRSLRFLSSVHRTDSCSLLILQLCFLHFSRQILISIFFYFRVESKRSKRSKRLSTSFIPLIPQIITLFAKCSLTLFIQKKKKIF